MCLRIWLHSLPLIPVPALSLSTEYFQWHRTLRDNSSTTQSVWSTVFVTAGVLHGTKSFPSPTQPFSTWGLVTPWIHLQFWLTSKWPEWTLDRHLKHSWLSVMLHFSMATTPWYQRLFLLMNLSLQRVEIKHSCGYTSCSLTGWRRNLFILYSSTWLTGIYYSCHHAMLDVEINGIIKRLPCWFKFSGGKEPQSMILPAISLRKHFLSSWIWAAVLLHYELESSKSLVPLAQSELYI